MCVDIGVKSEKTVIPRIYMFVFPRLSVGCTVGIHTLSEGPLTQHTYVARAPSPL